MWARITTINHGHLMVVQQWLYARFEPVGNGSPSTGLPLIFKITYFCICAASNPNNDFFNL